MVGSHPGVDFPADGDGRRSTSALGRAVVADALRAVDPVGARAAADETNWRREYRIHFRRLIEAGLLAPDAGRTIAHDGLAAVHARMRYSTVDADGSTVEESDLATAVTDPDAPRLDLRTVTGGADAEAGFSLPYRGARLRGADLDRQLDAWVAAGVIEPSCAEAVRTVAAHPEWLALPGRTVAVLGAGAEMGPLTALLHWGADVAALDLPRPAIWQRLVATARRGAGRLHLPVHGPVDLEAGTGLGADLSRELAAVAGWLARLDGRLVVGHYAYADGAAHVRVGAAVDAVTADLLARRDDVALAFLATPTDVFAVPAEAVAEATRRYGAPVGISRARRPLRLASAGRLFARNYPPGADPGVQDSLVVQQGPNYALAKRVQRWRATDARAAGREVSLRVAPATRTRSVVRNRVLAAAFAGAHRFGIEVFEPATSNTLMAALLVHDLTVGVPAREYPWQDEAFAAAHGGLWRTPYAPRSVLGIAVLLGAGATRG